MECGNRSSKKKKLQNDGAFRFKKRDELSPRFLDLFVHHSVGDNFKYSVVAASASGRAMRGFLNVREDVKEIFNLGVLIKGFEDIEVCYVLAVADLEILYGLCIDGLKVAGSVFGHCIFLRVVLLTKLYHIDEGYSVTRSQNSKLF